ncbi:DUF6314 family protein [Candidatus Nucleicultrix amoebiphila]|jgi:hypothetical protein|uniref:DUF6314 family protein n=1 Tax=Candidatus Nucleicultrix amoebiphila TaxID=1509244 RepID=UPI000A268288|nr:DUF6314 family protein [Candidatus Nucleicultrix amoebiphila]
MSHALNWQRWFEGEWILERTIVDRRQNLLGNVTGRLRIVKKESQLFLNESGVLHYGAYEGPVSQQMSMTFTMPYYADVFFANGRYFHNLDLREKEWRIEHHCGHDLYKGCYQIDPNNFFMITWQVNGPRKNLSLLSKYNKF